MILGLLMAETNRAGEAEAMLLSAWDILVEKVGFKLNLHETVNGEQMTTLWHADNVKTSHEEMEVSDESVDHLRCIHGDKEMWADHHTKLSQGKKFVKFRKTIVNS